PGVPFIALVALVTFVAGLAVGPIDPIATIRPVRAVGPIGARRARLAARAFYTDDPPQIAPRSINLVTQKVAAHVTGWFQGQILVCSQILRIFDDHVPIDAARFNRRDLLLGQRTVFVGNDRGSGLTRFTRFA